MSQGFGRKGLGDYMSNLSLNTIEEELEEKLYHSYLNKFIQKPKIDKDKLLLLFTLINHTSYSDKKKRSYILTTMIVQIALDTHDLVTQHSSEEETDQIKKNRQLTVLAGDYFSGLYYYMLSQIDDVEMISTLASAIKEINELKMNLYYESGQSLHALVDRLKKLESVLIVRVAQHVKKDSINEFAQNWLLTKKLVQEKDLYTSKQQASIFDVLFQDSFHRLQNHQALQMIETFIRKHLLITEELGRNLPVPFQSVKTSTQRFFNEYFSHNKLAMEEG